MLAAVGSVAGVRLLTGVLSPDLYGQLALAMTFFTLFQQILIAPFSGAFSRFYTLAQEKNQLIAYFESVFWLGARFSLLLLGLGILVVIIMGAAGQVDLAVMAIATMLYTLISGINIFSNSIQNAARYRIVVAWHQGIAQWLRFLGAVLLIVILSPSSQIAMFGYSLSAAMVLASQIFFLRRSVLKDLPSWRNLLRTAPDDWGKKILTYAYPSMFWGLFTWAQLTSDRWALQIFTTTQDVGFYSALYQLGYYPILLLNTVISQFIAPILFRQAGDATDPSRWEKTSRMTHFLIAASLAATVVLFIVTYLFHTQIFNVLVAAEYRGVSSYLPWLVLSSGLFNTGLMASLLIMSAMDTRKLIVPKITTAITGIGLNFLGAMWFGLPGVVAGSIIFAVFHLIWIGILNIQHSNR